MRMHDGYDDVLDFHRKFNAPIRERPQLLERDEYNFRVKFLQEELDEFRDAHERGDLAGAFDSLLDIVYVAFGTSAMMGLPWHAGWNEVQRANMEKMSAADLCLLLGKSLEEIGARHPTDVRKPEGWTPPNIEAIVDAYQTARF